MMIETSRGSTHRMYALALTDSKDSARRLASPLRNTLFFAGEATDFSGHNGTVHGAIASGQRAAVEVLESRHYAAANVAGR